MQKINTRSTYLLSEITEEESDEEIVNEMYSIYSTNIII